jgi:hypothetical protein
MAKFFRNVLIPAMARLRSQVNVIFPISDFRGLEALSDFPDEFDNLSDSDRFFRSIPVK